MSFAGLINKNRYKIAYKILRAGYGFCGHIHNNPKTFQVLSCKGKGIFPSLTIPIRQKSKPKNKKIDQVQITIQDQIALLLNIVISKRIKENE